MKALILTGGLGTRLRPLTCGAPKPLLPIVNVPFIHYQLRALRRQGVREVILATAYQPAAFRRALGDGRRIGLRLRYTVERQPMGTGGAVRHAARFLEGTTLILNGDILWRLDLASLLRRHRRARADVSISLVRVKDPTLFGLVETGRDGRIRRFLEKPSPDEITCDTVNAGAYLFEPSVHGRITRTVPYSLERGLFPELLRQGKRLFGFVHDGYWLDIGTIDKYLQAHRDILEGTPGFPIEGLGRRGAFRLAAGSMLAATVRHEGPGKVVLGRGTSVGPSVRFVGTVCLGERCRIGEGAVLAGCVVLDDARIGEGAKLEGSVVGRGCRVGAHAALGPGRVLGHGSTIADYSRL
ncbi:MAG: NDP-sugar synthase [Elusimicrobiota bacterium]